MGKGSDVSCDLLITFETFASLHRSLFINLYFYSPVIDGWDHVISHINYAGTRYRELYATPNIISMPIGRLVTYGTRLNGGIARTKNHYWFSFFTRTCEPVMGHVPGWGGGGPAPSCELNHNG